MPEAVLNIQLLTGWEDLSHENPDGPATFARADGVGALQVSWAVYKGGKEPRPSDATLIELASGSLVGPADGAARIASTGSGACKFGRVGSAEGSGNGMARAKSWILSNGLDFIFVTFVCVELPPAHEWTQAEEIALGITLTSR